MKGGVTHHIHKRKTGKKGPSFPHPDKYKRWLDRLVLGVAVISPLTAIPQLIKIWALKSAGEVSVMTWALLAFLAIPMFIYGIVHKDKPIIVMYALWLIVDVSVAVSALIYA